MRLRTGRGPIPPIAAAEDDRVPLELPSLRSRRAVILAAIGLAAYLIALLATIPANVVVPARGALLDVSGTVWRGEAALDGGARLTWRLAPLRSLVDLAFAADWTLRSGDAELGGRSLLHGGGRAVLDNVSGLADGSLLRAAMPDAPFACDVALQVDLQRLALGSGEQEARGEIRSEAGSCHPVGDAGLPTAVPPLILLAERDLRRGTILSLAPIGQRRTRLMEGSLSRDGRLELRITREGAAVLPFAAPKGGLSIQTRL